MSTKKDIHRFAPLDAFRGIAAFAVVLYHFTAKYREIYGHSYSSTYDVSYGYLGVHFFFLISGFVIFMTVTHCKTSSDFLYKRFTRLYPTFWLCLLITAIATKVLLLEKRSFYTHDLVMNSTMIPSFFGVRGIDGAYWSLLPEFFFYLSMALLMVTKSVKNIIFWGLIFLVLAWINKFVYPFPLKVGMMLNVSYSPLFFGGILFYLVYTKPELKRKWLYHFLILLCFITCAVILKNVTERVIVGCFFVCFYLMIYQLLDKIAIRPLIFLGSISYPLYLVHQNIGYLVMNYSKPYLSSMPILFVVVPIVVALVLATLIHYLFELPVMRLLRNIQFKYRLRSKSQLV